MEIELKYNIPADTAGTILSDARIVPYLTAPPETIHMHAIYYDTADGKLAAAKTALRLRLEGEHYICCMKRKNGGVNGFSRREEYECPADDIRAGIRALIADGAPAEILSPCLDAELVTVAEVRCVRQAAQLLVEDTLIELALDNGGFLTPHGTEIPFRELELELKEGREDALLAFGAALAKAFGLTPEHRSKFSRAHAARQEG